MREQIIQAAMRVFARKGFHAANVREILEEAQVSTGTLYHYFKSKEELLLEIYRREIDVRRAFFEELRGQGLSFRDQVPRILQMHFERVRRDPDLGCVMLIGRMELVNHLREEIQALYEGVARYVESIIREGMERGELRPGDVEVLAYAILGAIEAVTARALLHEDAKAKRLLKKAPQALSEALLRLVGCGAPADS
jgi:TetR/AcrR family fatty acid metabolism transcriptional regulator